MVLIGDMRARIDTYSTLELIEDLRSELRNHPAALAQIFPERVSKFNHRRFSLFWGRNSYYVSGLKKKFNNPNFRIPYETLMKLRRQIKYKLSVNTQNGIKRITP